MKNVSSFLEIPSAPGIYALYGGKGKSSQVAYVGSSGSLKARMLQHFVRRDSSVTTGVNAVRLDPDRVTKIMWWEYPDFADRSILVAAELVAFDVLEPVLRSRGNVETQARLLYSDEVFYRNIKALFEADPSGYFILPTLEDALERILALENSIDVLQKRLDHIEQKL